MATTHLSMCSVSPQSRKANNIFCQNLPPTSLATSRKAFPKRVVQVRAEQRDNLDYLQRLTTSKQPQTKRAPQVAPPGLWDRFPTARTVQQMIDTMERTMEDPFSYNTSWLSTSPNERDGYSRGRTPWAIKEREKDYKMRFDMPGMTRDDVKVCVEESMLVVKAEKAPRKTKEGEAEDKDDYGDEEWSTMSFGRYSCRISLPENVDFEKIKAEVKDGVLYITIPKTSLTSKVIDINVQ